MTSQEPDDLIELEIKTGQDLIDYIQRNFTSPELAVINSPEMRSDEACVVSKCVVGMLGSSDYTEYLVLSFNDMYIDD